MPLYFQWSTPLRKCFGGLTAFLLTWATVLFQTLNDTNCQQGQCAEVQQTPYHRNFIHNEGRTLSVI